MGVLRKEGEKKRVIESMWQEVGGDYWGRTEEKGHESWKVGSQQKE